MSRKKGIVFSAKEKTKIAPELLKEEQATMQLTSGYNFERFHSSIGYKQPMNYYLKTVQKAA